MSPSPRNLTLIAARRGRRQPRSCRLPRPFMAQVARGGRGPPLAGEPSRHPPYCARPFSIGSPSRRRIHRVASRLGSEIVPAASIIAEYRGRSRPIQKLARLFARHHAVIDRDPACDRFIEPFLYFRGLPRHPDAIASRIGSGGQKTRSGALILQAGLPMRSRRYHPAARIGKGVFLDHATRLCRRRDGGRR